MTTKTARNLTIVIVLVFAALLLLSCNIRQKNYVAAHPGLNEHTKQCILNRRFSSGMTKEQIRASIGEPDKIRRSAVGHKVMETWRYYRTYLYFYKGVVVGWDN